MTRPSRAAAKATAVVPEGAKRCTKCGKPKPLDAFYRAARAADGRQSWCKTCARVDQGRRYQEGLATPRDPAKKREYDRRYQQSDQGRQVIQRRRATPAGRLNRLIQRYRYLIRHTTDPERIASLSETLALYLADRERLRAQRRHAMEAPR